MDKNYLSIGFKRLLISLLLMFLGPTILFQAFKNESHEWYYYVLIVGLILCLCAILAKIAHKHKICLLYTSDAADE